MDWSQTILGAILSAGVGAIVAALSVVSLYGARITAIEVKSEMIVAWMGRVENKLDRVLENHK